MRVFISGIIRSLRIGFRIGFIFEFKIGLVNRLVSRFANGLVEILIY